MFLISGAGLLKIEVLKFWRQYDEEFIFHCFIYMLSVR
jgi:hypothetical protein